jgi:hypothetical protein
MEIYRGIGEAWVAYHQVAAMRDTVAARVAANPPADVLTVVKALDARLDTLGGNPAGGRGRGFRGGAPAPANFVDVNGTLVRQLATLDLGDMAPTQAMMRAYGAACAQLRTAISGWQMLQRDDLAVVNAALGRSGAAPLKVPGPGLEVPACGAAGRGAAPARAGRSNAPDGGDDPDGPSERTALSP